MHTSHDFLKDARADRNIVVIGSVSDITGKYDPKYKKLAELFREVVDLIVFVDPHAQRALRKKQNNNGNSIRGFLNIRNSAEFMHEELKSGDLVLLKGVKKIISCSS